MLEKEAIASFLFRERASLMGFIWSVTSDLQAAEDVFQEVSFKALARAETFESKEHLWRWSLVVARNAAKDWLLQQKRCKAMAPGLIDALANEWPTSEESGFELPLKALAECLKKLTTRSRDVLRMRYFESHSGVDIASFLGCKAESVYQSLARSHRRLRHCIQRRITDEAL